MALKTKKGKKASADEKKLKKGKKVKAAKAGKAAADDWGDEEDTSATTGKVKKSEKMAGKVKAKLVDSDNWEEPTEGKKSGKKGKKVKVKKGKKGAAPAEDAVEKKSKKLKVKGKKLSKTADGEDKPARDPISVSISDGAAKIRIRGSADLELPKYEQQESPLGQVFTADDSPTLLVNVTAATKSVLNVSIFKIVEAGGPLVKVLVRKVPVKTAADVITKFLYKGLEIKPPRKSKAKKSKPAKDKKAAKKAKPAKAAKKAKPAKAAKKGAKKAAKPAKKNAKKADKKKAKKK